jgi:AraC family transcriptional regulator
MNINTSRVLYQNRIDKAVQYINEHLNDQLCLEKVAKAAHFSPYHFHRVFSGMTGETHHDYLKHIRLEKAANMLIKMPSMSITEIAISCGYSSSSTFARAFKNHFFMSAMQYRQLGGSPKTIILKKPHRISQSLIQSMTITIQTLPGYPVVYVANLGGYEIEYICSAWNKLYVLAQANQLSTPDSKMIGISFDDPIITDPEKCRYYACITLPSSHLKKPAWIIWTYQADYILWHMLPVQQMKSRMSMHISTAHGCLIRDLSQQIRHHLIYIMPHLKCQRTGCSLWISASQYVICNNLEKFKARFANLSARIAK